MPELSIIVPVYNMERYLPKCIESILHQSFTDFELILVNDGSSDKSGKVCDAYAGLDDRVKVIHQKNQGVSIARNKGLDIASGRYIGFVDADDWIEESMYSTLISSLIDADVEIAICGMNVYSSDGNYINSDHLDSKVLSQRELLLDLFSKPSLLGASCCNRVFSSKVIHDLRFNSYIRLGEDREFLYRCFCNTRCAIKIYEPLYNVRVNPKSATRTIEPKTFFDIILTSKFLTQKTKNYSGEIELAAIDKYLDECVLYGNKIKSLDNKQKWFYMIRIRLLMLKQIAILMTCKKASEKMIHRYLYEVIKL